MKVEFKEICLSEELKDKNIGTVVKSMIEKSRMKKRDVAEALGILESSFSDKLKRNSMRIEEFLTTMNVIGYDIVLVPNKKSSMYKLRSTGVCPSTRKIINGVTYDTSKANALFHIKLTENVLIEAYKDYKDRAFIVYFNRCENGKTCISPIEEDELEKLSCLQ